MNIGIITNEDKDESFQYTKEIIKFVIDNKVRPIIPINFSNIINIKGVIFKEYESLFKKSDFIVVLGGDGTILRWSIKIAKYKKNILGINMGNLGYLTDVEKKDGFLAIEKVLINDYNVEKRMMLEATLNTDKYICLNEVNLNNGCLSRMIKIGIDINGKFVDAFSADGVIISTPTGSTAYNLSAGGPILKPDTELIVITYVCPHALFSRPYVISACDEISVYLTDKQAQAFLSLDGDKSVPIKYGERIHIKKSSFYTNIIKTTNFNFYDILRRKMFEVRR